MTANIKSLLGLIISLALTSCANIDVEAEKVPVIIPNQLVKPVSFDKDLKQIFLTKCGPCHLENGDRVNKWNNSATVKTYITGIVGRITRDVSDPLLMPKNGPKLSDAEINLIKKWIDDGFLE